ncbi:hypothetical protein ASPWEDRAFT_530957 [Aspergillus wentii DTO 134E9]|uniref:D-alanine--D-alanine ligase C-terminal domain-containing protein n=1 Tax=Aspergillus wentii DTO 134E9 TaxID=1073089 RepID=A0A1L9RLJ6_ASPWE|nr:uncharacterized protein ASPWEDRAFT_530957 [Aspergillus wentii DTO 134E9]OJJ35815.1 hypothetical protein ASPWEDRAFT_530957 [Aspergillus wentii DTO 134E9]
MANEEMPRLRIALIAEQQSAYLQLGYSEDECAALTHDGEVQAVSTTLRKLGHHVTLIPGVQPLVQQLAAGKHHEWDLAFNMAQGFHGSARESQVPALLEAYQVPYTFSDAATMALCQNKANTKISLAYNHIPTSPFVVIPARQSDIPMSTKTLPQYPLFVKLVTEGSSKGIDPMSKANGPVELQRAVQKLRAQFPGQDILVESFLPGREFTVGILGNGADSKVIGITEHVSQQPPSSDEEGSDGYYGIDFVSRKCKSNKGLVVLDHDCSDISDPQLKAASQVALDAWSAFGCNDAGRVDIRFDSEGPDSVPNVLEVGFP